MRLLALSHSLSEIDGVGRYAVAVLRECRRFCDEITVLLGRKHRGVARELPRGVRVRAVLPPDYWMYLSGPKFFAYLAWCLPRVYLAARRADLVHCLCDYPFSVPAWLAARAAGRPVVVSGHGTYSVAPFRYPLHRRLIARSYGGADAVLFGSAFAKERFEAYLHLPQVRVVDYGVDAAVFAGPPPPLPEGIPRPYVLCVGEVKERKGYEISVPAFIHAARRRPDLSFVVVGRYDREDPYFRRIEGLLEAAGMKDRVRFLGNVSEEVKHALFAHCALFLLAPKESREGGFEALGLVYLEAGACGVPVVGTLESGAVCAIRQGENGFLFPPGAPGSNIFFCFGGFSRYSDRGNRTTECTSLYRTEKL